MTNYTISDFVPDVDDDRGLTRATTPRDVRFWDTTSGSHGVPRDAQYWPDLGDGTLESRPNGVAPYRDTFFWK